jgi:hypothetical protein
MLTHRNVDDCALGLVEAVLVRGCRGQRVVDVRVDEGGVFQRGQEGVVAVGRAHTEKRRRIVSIIFVFITLWKNQCVLSATIHII